MTACEKILLDIGRVDEAYDKDAMTATGYSGHLLDLRDGFLQALAGELRTLPSECPGT